MSETTKARDRLSKYCVGNGVDLGYSGDPIIPSAITVDIFEGDNGYFGDAPRNLKGDASNLYWFKDEVLDYVYASHLLEDFENTAVVLKEWFRVLKPGGYLVIFGPDEKIYRERCLRTGQSYNEDHKIPDFGLDYLKGVLADILRLDQYMFIQETELIDEYCFELVVLKNG